MRPFCLSRLCAAAIVLSFSLPADAQFGEGGAERAPRSARARQNWDSVSGALAKRALTEPIPQDATRWLRRLALIHREIESAPPDGYYAETLFQQLASYQSESLHTIDSADPRLWAFLAAQSDWSHFVLILKTIFQNTTLDRRERVWQQAAALAKGGPTSRAYTLGEMEVLWGDPRRAIPVLEEALPRATTEQQSWELYRTLWSARSKQNDWKGMEAILEKSPLSGSRLELANAAAASGANDDAMRYFRKWFNQDRRRFAEFPPKPDPVLKELLRAFYRQLSMDEPDCATPTLAAKLFAD